MPCENAGLSIFGLASTLPSDQLETFHLASTDLVAYMYCYLHIFLVQFSAHYLTIVPQLKLSIHALKAHSSFPWNLPSFVLEIRSIGRISTRWRVSPQAS